MSDDCNENRKPCAIYFDTNALIEAKHAYTAGWFLSCVEFGQNLDLGLYVPQLVFDEYIFWLQETAEQKLSQIKSNLAYLSSMRMGPRQQSDVEMPMWPADDIREIYSSRLKGLGIETVPNHELPLETLLVDAIHHVAPFERGDKGFRDAVIIESVANHVSSLQSGAFFWVISKDKAFRRSSQRFQKRGVEALVLTPEEAPSHFRTVSIEAGVNAWLERRDRAKDLLLPFSEEIFDAIRQAKVELTLLESDFGSEYVDNPSIFHKISKLLDVRPVEIESVDWPGLVYDDEASGVGENRTVLNIRVTTEIDVVVDYYGLFGAPRARRVVPLAKRGSLSTIEEELPIPESPRYEEKTLVRDISVIASIEGNHQRPVAPKDFRIIRVRG